MWATSRRVVIAIVIPLLIVSIVTIVAKVRRFEVAIDTHHLMGKVFLIQGELGGDSQETRGRRYVAVMNANGTDSRILTEEFDRIFDLIWYPKLGRLGILNSSATTNRFEPGWYTLMIHGQGAANMSVDKIERSIPDNFRTSFFDPAWEYKNGLRRLLPDSKAYYTRVTFSPRGNRIAGIASFIISASKGFNIRMCVVPTDGSAPESCNQAVEPCEGQSPVWSPDGTKVVFAGGIKENKTACNLMELYIADADMKNTFQLTNVDGPKITKDASIGMFKPGMKVKFWHRSSHPRWSPDGQWIAFMSYRGIYRVHPDGTDLQLIIRDGYYPAWSPDGKMLMYVTKKVNPFRIFCPSDRIFVAYADGSSQTEIPLDAKGSSKYTYTDLNWAE